jgi:hypothetical protein
VTSGMKASTWVAATAGVLGFLSAPLAVTVVISVILVVGGLTILLFPIVLIFMFFNGLSFSGLGDLGDPYDGLTLIEKRCEDEEGFRARFNLDDASNRASAIITGDGRGKLEISVPDSDGEFGNRPCTVPEDLFDDIQAAGQFCGPISPGPVVIASQIQYESGFDRNFVGPNGARGISQVPKEVFTRLAGEEADPFDAKTSAAGGVPATDESQAYLVGVRTWFASMEGVGPIPRKISDIPSLQDDDGARGDTAPGAP